MEFRVLRLAAADPRVGAVAALFPGIPEEFTQTCPHTHTWPLLIDHWVAQLADRAIYLSVGSQATEACVRFAMKLFAKQCRTLPQDPLLGQLYISVAGLAAAGNPVPAGFL